MRVHEGDLVTVTFTAEENVEFDKPIGVNILTNLYSDVQANEEEEIILTVEHDWKFGDVVTEDDQPDKMFKIVDSEGVTCWDNELEYAKGSMRLVWLKGREL